MRISTDQAILAIDQTLRTLFGKPQVTERDNPADNIPDAKLTAEQSKDVAGLMRVNHAGEVCAQALYQGQALTAHKPADGCQTCWKAAMTSKP